MDVGMFIYLFGTTILQNCTTDLHANFYKTILDFPRGFIAPKKRGLN